LGFDSLDAVEMVVALEENFGYGIFRIHIKISKMKKQKEFVE
jgi:acyl carrier protein